jgi:hypothetical protein
VREGEKRREKERKGEKRREKERKGEKRREKEVPLSLNQDELRKNVSQVQYLICVNFLNKRQKLL